MSYQSSDLQRLNLVIADLRKEVHSLRSEVVQLEGRVIELESQQLAGPGRAESEFEVVSVSEHQPIAAGAIIACGCCGCCALSWTSSGSCGCCSQDWAVPSEVLEW